MVFESLVTDLLNRFLGDYVQNLDKNQLKIGIWGGDIVLHNLQLKQSALDELDLPVQTTFGSLGKLVLKIPWKNLYSAPVEATIENLYLLASPNNAVKYNAEKETKRDFEAKQAELKRIEEAKKKELEKDAAKIDPSFAEKLATQIINNVQIKIKDIHIRYEDTTSTTDPFAFGITLSNLSVFTTDGNWKKSLISQSISRVFKIAELEGLAVYFNSGSKLFSKANEKELPFLFNEVIATKETKPEDYNYILGPISSIAKLEINPNPEADEKPFTIPKIKLALDMEQITIGIMKSQYQDLIQLVEMMDRMMKGSPYRQYRPYGTPYKGNAKIWWHFAIKGVMHDVKRRTKNWSWDHIMEHRNCCRLYAEAYRTKRQNIKKPPLSCVQACDLYEGKLDLFNLVIIRQQIELELKREELKEEAQPKSSWFSGWWGGGQKPEPSSAGTDIQKQVRELMTPDEKAKLFKAIGYHENAAPAELPEYFVANQLVFNLKSLELSVKDDVLKTASERIMLVQLKNVACHLDQRPAAAAIKVQVQMHSFAVLGKQQNEFFPVMAKSQLGSSGSILDITFETNPLDKRCDQRVKVSSRPLEIVYDAQTIISLVSIFKPPANLNISQIQDVAANKLDNIKERSATGLQYIVDKHSKLELDINLMPTYVIIPQGGLYTSDDSNIVVVNLGQIIVRTEPRPDSKKDIPSMIASGATSDEVLKEMISQCYDRFNLELNDMQVMVVKTREQWNDIILERKFTEMHLLEPISIKVSAHICLIDDDPRLPKTKIMVKIPSIHLTMTEERLLLGISIGTSIPLPESDPVVTKPLTRESGILSSSLSLMKFLDDKQKRRRKAFIHVTQDLATEEAVQFTDLLVEFEMQELAVTFYRPKSNYSTPSDEYGTPEECFDQDFQGKTVVEVSHVDSDCNQKLVSFKAKQFEMNMQQRTYDMKVSLKLGGIGIDQYKSTFGSDVNINIINTPKFDDNNEYLFSLKYTNAKKDAPEFNTKYNSIEQLIEINFATLILLLHQEGIIELLKIATNFQSKLNAILNVDQIKTPKDHYATANLDSNAFVSTIRDSLPVISEEGPSKTFVSKRAVLVDSIKVKLVAKLEKVSVLIESEEKPISILNIQHLTASVVMKSSYTEVVVKLKDINIHDRNPESVHSTILSVVGDNAIACQIVLFNLDETAIYNSDNMKVKLSMGCVKIIFVNWFVQRFLSFLDHFQAAQKAIADASAAAADAAKNNMVDAYSNATRIKMDINIKAPIIIVPIDSKSYDALCLDLGFLKISNNNIEKDVNNEDGEKAVIDEMKLKLKSLKLSMIVINRHEESVLNSTSSSNYDLSLSSDMSFGINARCNILNPTSFVLDIERNLSASWYKDIPELTVSGKIKRIELNLLADDFKAILNILSKNMSEGANERPLAPPPPKKPVEPIDPARKPTEVTPSTNVDKLENDAMIWQNVARTAKSANQPFGLDVKKLAAKSKAEPTKKVDTLLKFAFQMESIVIQLFSEPNVGLASFGMYYLSLKGLKLVDESLSTSIILCDLILDDTRPNRENKITRFMKRRGPSIEKPKVTDDTLQSPTNICPISPSSMIDVVCNIKDSDMFVELKITSFDLILSLDYLMQISYFFKMPSDEEVDGDAAKSKQAQPTQSKQTLQPTSPPPEENKRMTIIFNLEQSDIVLVEKMDDINCNALILNSEIAMRFRVIDDRQVLKGNINNLNLYMCEFNPSRREITKHYVLHPCSLSVNGSTPEGKGLHISLEVSNIKLCVSPSIIELLNRAMVTMSVQEKIIQEKLKPPPNYSDIWKPSTFKEDDFWFMKTEEADEVYEMDIPVQINKPELCIAEIPSIILIIETGSGHQTIPMLYIETSMHAQVHNWSWQMSIESSLHLAMSYYNSSLALWEPLIEPNQKELPNGSTEYQPWELTFGMEIVKNIGEDLMSEEEEPTTKISVRSKDILELTVSKTCLDVLQSLGAAFSEAIKPEGLIKPKVEAPYIIQNDTGFEITLNLTFGGFHLHESHLPNSGYNLDETPLQSIVFEDPNKSVKKLNPSDVKSVKISAGGRAYLQLKPEFASDITFNISTDVNDATTKVKTLNVQVGDIKKEITLPVHKADERFFPLYQGTNQELWGIVSDIKVEYGTTVITIHGIVQVHNHFTAPITIFRVLDNNTVTRVGVIPPNAVFNVPLHAIYAAKKELHFSMEDYRMSIQGISWKENPSDFKLVRTLQCDPINTFEPFYLNAVRERKEIYHEVTSKFTMISACYVIHIRPPLILLNTLPIGLRVSVAGCSVSLKETPDQEKPSLSEKPKKEDFLDYGEKIVQPGEVLHLPTVKTSTKNETPSYLVVRLIQYLEKDWSCTTEIPSNPPDFSVWTFNSYDSVEKMQLDLGVRFENRNGTFILSIYCPFWMVNKTGLMLSYRHSDESTNVLYHPPEYNEPILFSFREKAFFGKKKASVRIDTGEWSDKFSLDVAGSSGVVECDANSMTYQIAVHNTLTHNSLTKQIMFMPYFILINKSTFDIEIQEDQRPGDSWLCVKPNDSVPFWPKNLTNKMMRVRTADGGDTARSFNYTEVQETLLKLDNKFGGIHVDVHVTEGGIFITFDGYYPGHAPALIINHTTYDIKFWEKGNINERTLLANQKILYTWSDPAGERIILWNDGNNKTPIENDLRRDDVNQFTICNTGSHSTRKSIEGAYWVSFLDGTQRVLLFTDNEFIAREAESSSRLDKVNQEISIEIQGIGLSLVNNIKQCDVMYIGIASSGVIWEEKKKRFKPMKIQEVAMMEESYQEYSRDCATGKQNEKRYYIDNEKIEVSFDRMIIRKSTERPVRRLFYPGLWLQMKTSPFQTQIHAKINRIQIDNQTSDCIFPVVLAPVPPPKSVAATTELKPFIECSIVQRVIPHSNVKQFKYCRVLTQEFHIKVDLMFINELSEFLNTEVSDEESAKQFAIGLAHLVQPLSAHVQVHSQQEQKNFYDQLHLGPLKIHISFSMAGSESKALPGILSTILQGVGVTLTDINDVVFRLAFFEREYSFLTQRQLVSECVSHYAGQAVKQLYVLVLGLDVIGNPYGLVVGFTKGVEDLFYEPFQGAIQGPGEFAEGLVLGVRSLFGHTVGGAAGAVSKITGAMGKGIAALTFDKDYQKKRRDQLNKKPANLQEGLARSGKGLVMGVVDGVTGVFTKPISGAKADGVEGFFKGLGKGAVGLVARPTAGIVDFASGSFEAVKRATELGEDINRLRPPRFLHSDGVVRPFNCKEAEGNKLLKEIEKGKYSNTDTFAHLEVIKDKREIILLSDHRILYVMKNDIFGGWQIEWTYRWSELKTIVSCERGVELVLATKEQKKILGLFSSSDSIKKIILIPTQMKRDMLANMMNSLKQKQTN